MLTRNAFDRSAFVFRAVGANIPPTAGAGDRSITQFHSLFFPPAKVSDTEYC